MRSWSTRLAGSRIAYPKPSASRNLVDLGQRECGVASEEATLHSLQYSRNSDCSLLSRPSAIPFVSPEPGGRIKAGVQSLDRTAREVVTNQPGEEPPNGYGRHMRSPVNIGTMRYGRLYAANFHGRGDAQPGTGLPSSSAKIISMASVSAPA